MNPKINTCLSTDLIEHFDLEGKRVVIIDILRATTTITAAFNAGIEKIIPVASLEECLEQDESYLKAAERGGKKPEGFEFGNSPYDYLDKDVNGKTLVLTTSNGTRALQLSTAAEEILIGAFTNINAIADQLISTPKETILFCSGWKGNPCIEDSLFAGALLEGVLDSYDPANDASQMVLDLYRNNRSDLNAAIRKSEHYSRLSQHADPRDFEFAVRTNSYSKVPFYKAGEVLPG